MRSRWSGPTTRLALLLATGLLGGCVQAEQVRYLGHLDATIEATTEPAVANAPLAAPTDTFTVVAAEPVPTN
ncbi:MAG: hypothetical protein ACYTG1_12060 [Planctomycetota bacterium]